MLKFEPKFFEEEVRDGFTIAPMMKNAWAAQLEVLSRFDEICTENHIIYFAEFGTLLGAVRHKGFIPWDDDIDLCMLRDEFNRLIEVVDDYDGIRLDTIYNNPNKGQFAARIWNTTKYTLERDFYKEYHGFPFPAGLDIFILDYIPREKELLDEQILVLKNIGVASWQREWLDEHDESDSEYDIVLKNHYKNLRWIENTCQIEFSQEYPTEQEILILGEEVSGLYSAEDSDYVSVITFLSCGGDYYIPKDIYSRIERIPFENTTIPVPKNYDFVLKETYGEDYMTPMQVLSGHNYPFYNRFLDELCENGAYDSFQEAMDFVYKSSCGYYLNFLKKNNTPTFKNVDGDSIKLSKMEILGEVLRICKTNNISIYVVDSTISEIRDNDALLKMDLDKVKFAVARSDYSNFIEKLQLELAPWFNYKSVWTHDYYYDLRTTIYSDKYLCDEEEYKKRFHGCEDEVEVYIYVIDSISDNDDKEKIRVEMVKNLITTAWAMPIEAPYSDEILDVVKKWSELTGVDFDVNKDLRREFVRAADIVGGASKVTNAKMLRLTADLQDGVDDIYDS